MEHTDYQDSALRIGKRIAEVAVMENLNQKSLAEKLGVSQGFLSSVINDQKIPGSEFLYILNKVFGVSADWVLTGEGGMYGGSKINIRLQKEIQLYIAIARAAIVEGNPKAQALLSLIREDRLESVASDESIQAFIKSIAEQNQELELITAIYNNIIWVNDTASQRRIALATAIEHFQLRAPVDLFNNNKGQIDSRIQINVGKSQINVQGNYNKR